MNKLLGELVTGHSAVSPWREHAGAAQPSKAV